MASTSRCAGLLYGTHVLTGTKDGQTYAAIDAATVTN